MNDADTPPPSLLLVGCGKMGGALLAGWLARGTDPARVLVVDPGQTPLPAGIHRVASAAALPPLSPPPQVVVLAVKPQVMAEAIAPYATLAGGDTVFLSIAAGKTIDFFRHHLGAGAAVVRAMPNTPAAVGAGMTVLCAGPGVTQAQRAVCQTLVEAVGTAAWLDDEGLMDAVTAVSGSGPAYVFHLVEALAAGGVAAGLPADLAMTLARQTVIGAGALLAGAAEDAATLRHNVTSPGGTTAAALEVLMDPGQGFPPLLTRAVAAATARGRALAG